MKHIRIDELPWEELRSPTGRFHSFFRNLSLALGGLRNTGPWGGGHPFDVQIRRVPAGAAICPFHSHLAQSELFIIRAGEGLVRVENETHEVKPGDVFYHPPTEHHQLANSGTTDLEVLIITDNPPVDAFHYPDSNKWGLRPGSIFRIIPCDYMDGEDDPANADVSTYQPALGLAPPAITPFSSRKASIEALVWENFDSPQRKFRGDSKALSEAVGAKRNTPAGLGGHPFDLELGRLPPGFSGCPFHSHATQWEFYIFLSGHATVRTQEGLMPVTGGEVVLHPPGEAHQFTNTGTDDLLYFLIADNPPFDAWYYPDSNKWGLSSPRQFFRTNQVDYWDGEE